MVRVLKVKEVAEYLRVSERHLLDMRKDPSFPRPVRLGKNKVVFKESDIKEFVEKGGLA